MFVCVLVVVGRVVKICTRLWLLLWRYLDMSRGRHGKNNGNLKKIMEEFILSDIDLVLNDSEFTKIV
jgi:hypothetical protein